ncbi:hypothetical protein EV652_121117 [Kribbella steppae]|uniref:Uncharacterized protein n=1 Tax=Kribbella steppae TaxID=2512223 RepID=A0A4R2GXK2_9ACTN|nr:hypothetical protein EV652_121117 [Kribbella steppae]
MIPAEYVASRGHGILPAASCRSRLSGLFGTVAVVPAQAMPSFSEPHAIATPNTTPMRMTTPMFVVRAGCWFAFALHHGQDTSA